MRTILPSLIIASLSFGLGAPAAHAAANPFVGSYTMAYMDHDKQGQGQYGTMAVSTTGSVTITLVTYVGNDLNKQSVLHGTVSSTGAVKFPGAQDSVAIKFLKQGSTVLGFTGSTGKGGVMVGVRKPS